jgi:alpha-glucosidase
MQWSRERHGGFTSGEPWLPTLDSERRNVSDQRQDPASLLSLYRDLIALRGELGDGMAMLDAARGLVAYSRGDDHVVALNLGDQPAQAPPEAGEVVLPSEDGAAGERGVLAPRSGAVYRRA